MNEPSPHQYRHDGMASGVPVEVLNSAQRQRLLNLKAGSHPILSLNHLARLSGVSLSYLRRIVKRQTDPYTNIRLEKRSGGVRPISAPEPVLLEVQRVVLARALDAAPLHPSAYAYRKNRSIVDCANQHAGAKWLIKLDLHDFFGNIDERQVYDAFTSRGYSPLVAFELARLCTRVDERVLIPDYVHANLELRYPAIPSYTHSSLGRLPQGAPTSGALANLSVSRMDDAIYSCSLENGLIYTRYSDDITLSTASPFSRAQAKGIVDDIVQIVKNHGHSVHHKKTRIIPPGARHVVLGLLLTADGVGLLPEFRRRVEVHIRGVHRFGLIEHAEHRGFRSILSFVNHVDGCLAFALDVDREWSTAARKKWEEALSHHHFPALL